MLQFGWSCYSVVEILSACRVRDNVVIFLSNGEGSGQVNGKHYKYNCRTNRENKTTIIFFKDNIPGDWLLALKIVLYLSAQSSHHNSYCRISINSSKLLSRTLLANSKLLSGTLPTNNKLLSGTRSGQ